MDHHRKLRKGKKELVVIHLESGGVCDKDSALQRKDDKNTLQR